MKKKLISLLLTVAMVASIIGTIPVFAADTAGGPTLDFTTGAPDNLPADDANGTGYNWVKSTKTLTLNGFTYASNDAKGIILPDGATIKLVGTNVLKTTADAAVNSYGIEVKGTLTITGDGSLAVTSSNTSKTSYGIYSYGALTINDTANVTATGGEATAFYGESYGIYSYGAVTIKDKATVTATGGDTKFYSYGIYSGDLTITDSTVTAIGGEATGASYGIVARQGNAVTIKDSATVTATGGTGGTNGVSYGINSGANIDISDSTNVLDIQSGTATTSVAVYGKTGINIVGASFKNPTGAEVRTYQSGNAIFGKDDTDPAKHVKSGAPTPETPTNGVLDFTTGTAPTGDNFTWDSGTKTLTLNNFNYTSTDANGIILPAGATIVLVGDNTLTTMTDAVGGSYGIEAKGKLTITGTGDDTNSLDVTSSNTTGSFSIGIYSANLTITDSAKVTATGGEATADGGESYGIYSNLNVTITDSNVTATGGEAASSTGIYSRDRLTIDGKSTVTATGGKATGASFGIKSGAVTITDSTVTATGVEATDASFGIYSYSDLTINGGSKVTATASNATNMSVGISGGTIDISDPTNVLDIKSGDAIMVSAAVFGGDIDIGEVSFDIPVGAHVAKVAMPEDLSILSDEEPEEQGPFAIFGKDADKPAKHVQVGVPTPPTPPTPPAPETPTIPEIKPSDNKTFKHDRNFDTLESIQFNGQDLKLTDGGDDKKFITGYNGVDTVNVGEVTRGSVIITMYPQFLRTLPLGTHVVALTFKNSDASVPAEEDVIQQFTLVADKTTNFPSYPSYPSYGGGYYGSSTTTVTATTYNVTLNLFDGATETVKTEDGNIIKLPANPIREGYVFLGWYTDKELTKMVAPDTRITANTTIYARWHKTVEMPTVTEPTEVPQTSDSWFKF